MRLPEIIAYPGSTVVYQYSFILSIILKNNVIWYNYLIERIFQMDKEEKKIIKSFNNSIIDEKKTNTDYLILVWGLSFIILVIITFIVGIVQNMDKPNLVPWVIYFVIGILIFIYRYIKTKKQRFIISIIFSLIIIFGLILYINKK